MHVHLIGVAGMGMGALAGALVRAGHDVSGSDRAFHPPMGPALRAWGVTLHEGYAAAHLSPRPDLVVVGNVCRRDNPEARAAIDGGFEVVHMPEAMGRLLAPDATRIIAAGTHGKSTTSTLLAYLLERTGHRPGFFIGALPMDFDVAARPAREGGAFVIEGDEYDTAFFEKTPKLWHYGARFAQLTSAELDHIDIYPNEAAYLDAFRGFVSRMPEDGLLVAFAGDANVREVARAARCRVVYYALDSDDTGELSPAWVGAPARAQGGLVPIDLFGGGSHLGRVLSPLSGAHNARNALGAIALLAESGLVPLASLVKALPGFGGLRRRQELLGVADGVRVYEDFAHHPTAVRATLSGLRDRHRGARILAAYEPRSATACRKLHEGAYPAAFASADEVFLAPIGRPDLPEDERLDAEIVAAAIRDRGRGAAAYESIDALEDALVAAARPNDVVVLMSNGAFGGIYARVLARWGQRSAEKR